MKNIRKLSNDVLEIISKENIAKITIEERKLKLERELSSIKQALDRTNEMLLEFNK